MKTGDPNPRSFDVSAAARQGESVDGVFPLAAMHRLYESAHEGALPGPEDGVTWRAACESRPVRGAAPQVWLHLSADTRLSLVCQRCLQPVSTDVHAQRSFLFVAGENTAAELDADSDDDVLALTRSLDLIELMEDELLLSLPLVPRHAVCPQPLSLKDDPQPLEERPNPFAALAALKRGGRPS